MSEGIKRDCKCTRAKHEHGTIGAYKQDKCRCQPCRGAKAAEGRQVRRNRAYGRKKYRMVDATPVREHLQMLSEHGIGQKQVAELTGLGLATIGQIRWGKPSIGLAPAKTVQDRTSHSILSIRPSLENQHGKSFTTPDGTIRRIQALASLGYGHAALARELDMNRNDVGRILFRRRWVHADTARKVRDVYDRLWNVPAPERTGAERQAAARARNNAAARGYLPPLAWDDDSIDVPGELIEQQARKAIDTEGKAA